MTTYTCEPTGFYSKSESSSKSWITFVASTSIALSHRDLHPQALVPFRLLRQHEHLLSLQILHLQLRNPRTGLEAGVLWKCCLLSPSNHVGAQPCGGQNPAPYCSLIVRTHNMFISSILTCERSKWILSQFVEIVLLFMPILWYIYLALLLLAARWKC